MRAPLSPRRRGSLISLLISAQLLALVGNLSEVGWNWTDEDGVFHEEFITVEEVNALLPEWTDAYNAKYGARWVALSDIKDYAASPAALQKLLHITNPYK